MLKNFVGWLWFSMAAVADISAADANKMDSKPKPESEFTVQKLVDMFTKLNPLAKEFFPSSYSLHNLDDHHRHQGYNNQLTPTHFLVNTTKPSANDNYLNNRRVSLFCLWSLNYTITDSFLVILINFFLSATLVNRFCLTLPFSAGLCLCWKIWIFLNFFLGCTLSYMKFYYLIENCPVTFFILSGKDNIFNQSSERKHKGKQAARTVNPEREKNSTNGKTQRHNHHLKEIAP